MTYPVMTLPELRTAVLRAEPEGVTVVVGGERRPGVDGHAADRVGGRGGTLLRRRIVGEHDLTIPVPPTGITSGR